MPAQAPPPADLRLCDSHRYWRESDARIKQCWYVSFCLMMSSVQDRLTGLALREARNLNWATTAFYYSAVHAGRLLCFLCAGDYPTAHADLANLLAPAGNGRVRFDWLNKFRAYVGGTPGAQVAAPQGTPAQLRSSLLRTVGAGFPGASARVDRFAPLLSAFKNLRNDANYESLLIAHEKEHFLVTKGFDELAQAANDVSDIATEMATALYAENLVTGDPFAQDRDRFLAAHRLYLRGRFERSLIEKFSDYPSAMNGLQRAVEALTISGGHTPELSPAEVEAFLDPIMYDTFGEKQGLMRRWKRDVEALRAEVIGAHPPATPAPGS